MQKFISKYGLAAHLAVLAVLPLFLAPYASESAVCAVLFWMSLICSIWYFFEPSRRPSEMLHEARGRVAAALFKDPLFWIFAAICLISALRLFNCNVGMMYDTEVFRWKLKESELSFFPAGVEGAGMLQLATSVSLLVLVESCRHALGKGARLFFISAVSILAGFAGFAGAVACYFNVPGAVEASRCHIAASSYIGTSYGIYATVGIAALAGSFEIKWNKAMLLYSTGTAGCLVGLYFFAPSYVIVFFLAALLATSIASFFYAGIACDKTVAFKCVASLLMSLFMVASCCMALAPEFLETARLEPFIDGKFELFGQQYMKIRALCASFASKVWNSSPWLGTGLGTFPLNVRFNATFEDWAVLPPGQSSAVVGWWHVLAERGLVGAVSFCSVVVALVVTFVVRAVKSVRSPVRPFYPVAAAAIAVFACFVAQIFFDTSFLRTDVLLAGASLLALGGGSFIPVLKGAAPADGGKKRSRS